MNILLRVKNKLHAVRWKLANYFSSNLIVKTKFFKIKVSSKDAGIGREFYFSGTYGLDSIDTTFDFLKKQKLYKPGKLLDIGANIGHVTLYCLANNFSDSSICVEPDSVNFQLLKDNIALNHLEKKVVLKKTALGTVSGKEKIILSTNNFGDHRIFTSNEMASADKYNDGERKISEIDIERLDDMAERERQFDNVNLISLDVQGYELEILKGGLEFFKRGIPMMLEIDPYLLEKKGASGNDINDILIQCYTHFLDLTNGHTTLPISDFSDFYEKLKNGNTDYKDILLYNTKQS